MIAPQITQQVIQSSMQSQASVETTSGQQTGPISIPGLSLKSPIMFNIVNQDASGQNDFSLSAQVFNTTHIPFREKFFISPRNAQLFIPQMVRFTGNLGILLLSASIEIV